MKQKDIALIVVVVILSGAISLFLSKALFGGKSNNQQNVEVVDAINAGFPTPSQKYFNANSIDPTQIIKIGESNNNAPFKDSPTQ